MNLSSPEELLLGEVASHPSVDDWRRSLDITEQRHVLLIQPEDIVDNLTTTTLSSENSLPLLPFVFVDNRRGALNAFYYLGRGLAGHSGILHGGLLGVLLDECLGRACFPLLPNRIGVTASLEISFKAPTNLPCVILIQAETEKVEGRKAWVKATVKMLGTSKVLVATATAYFIEPKSVMSMKEIL